MLWDVNPDWQVFANISRSAEIPTYDTNSFAALNMPVLDSLMKQGDRLWFNLAYTYNDFFFDGDSTYGNSELSGVSPHFVRAELLYKHPSGFYAGPNTEWVPKGYFADNANQVMVDHYTLLNLKAGYEAANANWSAYVEGRNLSDKRYIANVAIAGAADATAALFNPGTGRAVYSGIRFKW